MEWININDRLPEIPDCKHEFDKRVKVIGSWGEQWAEFYYVRKTIRGKIVERFEWGGRINTFPITHWAIPEPPKTFTDESK